MTKVAAAIIKQDGKILICKRGAGGSCEHLWEFPGGKQEEGETLTECLERECREELGISIRVNGVFESTRYKYPGREIFFTFFNAEIIKGELKPAVHEEIKWVFPDELSDYEFCPADREIVRKLSEEK